MYMCGQRSEQHFFIYSSRANRVEKQDASHYARGQDHPIRRHLAYVTFIDDSIYTPTIPFIRNESLSGLVDIFRLSGFLVV